VIAVTLQAADQGDTTTIQETLAETATNLAHLIEREAEKAPDEEPQVSLDPLPRSSLTRVITATMR